MRINTNILLFLLVIFNGSILNVNAQNASYIKLSASTRLLQMIKIVKVEDMNFGKILIGYTGSVLLTTSGSRSAVGANVVGTTGWSPAKFDVRGTNDYEYYIALPSNIVLKNGDNEIRVENLVAKPSSSSDDALVGMVKSDSYFTVGGRLVINSSNLPAGIYTSSFDVSIGYN